MTDFTLLAYGVVWAASIAVLARWHREIPRTAAPLLRRAIDSQRHTVTLVGRDGRTNPARYECFPTYAAALAYQRKLARGGQACVVTHTDSGEVRIDFATVLGPFGRIYY